MEQYVMLFASVALAIIGYFIVRFFNSVDKISQSVDAINQKLAIRDENMKAIQEDIHEIREKQREHSKRMHDMELRWAQSK